MKSPPLLEKLDGEAKAFLDRLLLVNKPDGLPMSDTEYLSDSYALLESGAIVVTVDGDRLSVEINPEFRVALRALGEAQE